MKPNMLMRLLPHHYRKYVVGGVAGFAAIAIVATGSYFATSGGTPTPIASKAAPRIAAGAGAQGAEAVDGGSVQFITKAEASMSPSASPKASAKAKARAKSKASVSPSAGSGSSTAPGTSSGTPSGGSGSSDTSRSPYAWPFSWDSIWN